MLVLEAFSGTRFTAAAATSGRTLRTIAARAVLDAYNGPEEAVAGYGGPHKADADWARPYEGPREADADWTVPYEGPHNAAGVWSSPSVLSLSLMDPSLRSPLSDTDATMVDGVPVSSFHALFDRCYEPAAPDCVRRSGLHPRFICPALCERALSTSAPCSLPSTPSVTQELVAEGGYFFANRLIMLVAVEIRGKRRYIPMLCDTGAPKTCVSTITLEKFGLEASTANHISIKLGERSVYAAIPDENCAAYVRGLNILGSDVLQLLVPDLVPLLISSINREAKRC